MLHSTRVHPGDLLPLAQTTGKASNGVYNTAQLKDYPSALCLGFAKIFDCAAAIHVQHPPCAPAAEQADLLAAYQDILLTTERGPDFAN